MLVDAIKMIAYRAETALVGLLIPHLNKEEEARALVRQLLVSAADIIPNPAENILTARIHRMACPAHDKAVQALLATLTEMKLIVVFFLSYAIVMSRVVYVVALGFPVLPINEFRSSAGWACGRVQLCRQKVRLCTVFFQVPQGYLRG